MIKGVDQELEESSEPEKLPSKSPKSPWLRRPWGFKTSSKQAVSDDSQQPKQPANDAVPQTLAAAPTSGGSASRPVAMLPRQQTFKRQQSERRDNLQQHLQQGKQDSRTLAQNRERSASEAPAVNRSTNMQPANPVGGSSFSDIRTLRNDGAKKGSGNPRPLAHLGQAHGDQDLAAWDFPESPGQPPSEYSDQIVPDEESDSDVLNHPPFWEELDRRFTLCLSMQFRDGSDREKFFVTYIEKPNHWLRVTISCDYRDAPENSLETVIKSLPYQRDKIARIYEAIKDSLGDIKFYDTVTNLKLQTSGKRLHVHVAEDLNEITEFPLLPSIAHLNFHRHNFLVVPESDVIFESHLSGFVYKVSVRGSYYIKKEISSPDTVEEFLYEINALAALRRSPGIIDLVGVVADEKKTYIKGLLIEWASTGSIADFIYEHHDKPVSWDRRQKWARQVVSGIADIHEAGFVQGDCTISNIVLDSRDNVRIVDINRRGCPVGYEPPEFEGLIRDGQKVSMYIGVKSDLYQLGMILWAIATMIEEPEHQDKPLKLEDTYPKYYRDIVAACLSESPTDRLAAKSLLEKFPRIEFAERHGPARAPSPLSAADLEDLREHQRVHPNHLWPTQPTPRSDLALRDPSYDSWGMDQETLLAGMDHSSQDSALLSVQEPPSEDQPSSYSPFGNPPPSMQQQSSHPFHPTDGYDPLAGIDAHVSYQHYPQSIEIEEDPSFAGPIHQDSGLPIDPADSIDDDEDPLADIDARLRPEQYLNLEPMALDPTPQDLDSQDFPRPVHQDSGFNEKLPEQPSSTAVKPALSVHSEKQQEEDRQAA